MLRDSLFIATWKGALKNPSRCVQPAGNERNRCLLQRLARLIKNERRNTRTITSPYGSPFIARKSWLSREIDQHVAG